MAKSKVKFNKESAVEKASRFFRNINALGALAVGGLALAIPGPNVILASYAGWNAAQAGGWELMRSHAEKKRRFKK